MNEYLDNPPLPYQKHSEPSRAAAMRERPFASKKRKAVYRFIADAGPAGRTDKEIAQHFQDTEGWTENTTRPRRIELRDLGYLVPVTDGQGYEIRRDHCTVWRAK